MGGSRALARACDALDLWRERERDSVGLVRPLEPDLHEHQPAHDERASDAQRDRLERRLRRLGLAPARDHARLHLEREPVDLGNHARAVPRRGVHGRGLPQSGLPGRDRGQPSLRATRGRTARHAHRHQRGRPGAREVPGIRHGATIEELRGSRRDHERDGRGLRHRREQHRATRLAGREARQSRPLGQRLERWTLLLDRHPGQRGGGRRDHHVAH